MAFRAFVFWLLLASTLVSVPMFATGLDGPDYHPHLRWSGQFADELAAGAWYPRWLSAANYGYGNPTFFFHGPAFYYAVAVVRLLVPATLPAMLIACWLGFVLSGLAMYAFAREFHPHRQATVAALAYVLLPYHAMDLYSRTALAEFWAFIWPPLVLLFAWRTWQGSRLALPGLALSYAALVFTHLCSALLTTLALAAYAGFLCWADRPAWQKLVRLSLGVALGLALSAVYLLPAALEQSYVQIRLSTALPFGNVLNNFLFAHPWYALGFSIEVSLGAMLMTALFLACLYLFRRAAGPGQVPFALAHATFWAILGLVCILLSTAATRPLWLVLPVLPAIQFPWRFMFVATLAGSMALAAAWPLWGELPRGERRWLRRRFLAFTLALVFVPGFAWLYQLLRYDEVTRPPQRMPSIAEVKKDMTDAELYRVLPALNMDHGWDILEFRPVWAPLALARIAPPVEWDSGTGMLRVEAWAPLYRRLYIAGSGVVKLRTFYYPGWVARLDGREAPVTPDPADGRLSVAVPPGGHTLTLDFEDTPLQRAAAGVSWAALLAVLLLAVVARRPGQGGGSSRLAAVATSTPGG